MIDKAIEKITKEMMEINTSMAIAIEEYLCGICKNDEVASKLLNTEKTLKKAIEFLYDEARKVKKNNVAVMRDEEVYKLVNKYYEIETETENNEESINTESIDLMSFL
jgi:formyltetrahydrofolate synthetase